ncbi:type II secretion system protein [Candidatus Binatus sp.]|uniref:type II secretion system protein n=1 Tax=Candidatus Binatus sp. TaxID=2811406 RepID=UPI003C632EA8
MPANHRDDAMKRRPGPDARRARARADFGVSSASPGFTLLELAVVIFIMGLMLTLALPYLGGFREAALKSQARRLAGRATYMFDEATGHKLVLRLIFDLDNNGYAAAQLDPYAVKPVFAPDTTMSNRPVMMPAAIRIRDVTIEGIGTVNRGVVATNFYPEGYVDATVVHLEDASGDVMTLEFSPLTGQVAIVSGDVMPAGMSMSR